MMTQLTKLTPVLNTISQTTKIEDVKKNIIFISKIKSRFIQI